MEKIFTPLHPQNPAFKTDNELDIKIKPSKKLCLLRWGGTEFIFLSMAVVFAISRISFAEEPPQVDAVTQATELNNKICPVSGEKIDEKTKVAYEYEGKIYNFCCQMCIDEFKNDPQKYIDKVKEELKGDSQKETKEEPMQGAESSSKSSTTSESHHN